MRSMRLIRLYLYGIPILLIVLLVVAFLNASFLSVAKKNEMSIGTIGEPSTLNPIQQADSASSEVGGLIFNGLLKYNQNLDIVGDLATSWELSQETTFQFGSEKQAAEAKSFLDVFARTNHPEWPITSTEVAPRTKLIIRLSEPGYKTSKEIAQVLIDNEHYFIPFHNKPLVTAFLAEPIIHFTLQRDVRWHDGKPFTSADVLFTYKAIIDPRVASPRSSDFELVSSVTTPSPYEIIVRYKKPFSPALLSWMGAILPAHLLDGIEPAKWADFYNRHPIGTGPFKFDSWKTNEFIRLVKKS